MCVFFSLFIPRLTDRSSPLKACQSVIMNVFWAERATAKESGIFTAGFHQTLLLIHPNAKKRCKSKDFSLNRQNVRRKKCLRYFFFFCFVLITPVQIKMGCKKSACVQNFFLFSVVVVVLVSSEHQKSAIKKGFWIYGFSVENHLFGHHKNRQSKLVGSSRAATRHRCRFAVLKSIFVWRTPFTLISWKAREKSRNENENANEMKRNQLSVNYFIFRCFDWDVVYFLPIFLFAWPFIITKLCLLLYSTDLFFASKNHFFPPLHSSRNFAWRKIWDFWHKLCVGRMTHHHHSVHTSHQFVYSSIVEIIFVYIFRWRRAHIRFAECLTLVTI